MCIKRAPIVQLELFDDTCVQLKPLVGDGWWLEIKAGFLWMRILITSLSSLECAETANQPVLHSCLR